MIVPALSVIALMSDFNVRAQVLKNGEHTGAKPGRVVRGPGWKKTSVAQ